MADSVSGPVSTRVMTYNILQGGKRGAALDAVVRGAAPDVLMVNECPKQPLTWKGRCHRLASSWGLGFVAGGRPAGSNMLLVRSSISVEAFGVERIRQPLFQPRRGLVWAQLRLAGELVGVVSCHLSLNRERRTREVERVLVVAASLSGPVIIAGDLNEGPQGPSWQRLVAEGYVDHGSRTWLTFPSDAPTKRIDAVLVRGDLPVSHLGDPGVDASLLAAGSDHRPVLAVLEVASPADPA